MIETMTMTDRIRAKLEAALHPTRLEILDDSASHVGHRGNTGGGETHFNLVIAAPAFAGLSRVARQRLVHDALREEMVDGIHALSIEVVDTPSQRER